MPDLLDTPTTTRGQTVAEVAKRYRVGEDKVRGWIRRAELAAINTADARCGKPRYVVTPEALTEFERRRAAAAPPKPTRRKRTVGAVDYYAGDDAETGGAA